MKIQADSLPPDIQDAKDNGAVVRTASCSCGSLKVTVSGPPVEVYACSCLECQLASGSVFTYAAVFRDAAVMSIEGEYRSWRRGSDSGRWVESSFCPTCGSPVMGRTEATPGFLQVSAGSFADPSFASPVKLYWASMRHHWLPFPPEVETIERQ